MSAAARRRYRATESKYRGGAREMYVTYDLAQKTRGGGKALYPKVKRVYIAGDVTGWQAGDFAKRSGRQAHGVKIEYEQEREGYTRQGFTATRGDRQYSVAPAKVKAGRTHFSQVVEVPEGAQNVAFHADLPARYRDALQDVR